MYYINHDIVELLILKNEKMKKEKELSKAQEMEQARNVSNAMGEEIISDLEMEMSEGGKAIENALANCSTNNCHEGNCVRGCGSEILQPDPGSGDTDQL